MAKKRSMRRFVNRLKCRCRLIGNGYTEYLLASPWRAPFHMIGWTFFILVVATSIVALSVYLGMMVAL
jgi:hypothetical protein